ncbi:MAG TPA: FtsX-like permease family protein [Ktedonobacterales bacterium]
MVAGTRDRERRADLSLAGGPGRGGGVRGRRGARASLFSAARLARMHLARGWRMLLIVGLGMLVAVVLLASVPLYSLLIGNVQLQATLYGDEPVARNVELQVPGTPLTADLAQRADAIAHPLGTRALAAYTDPAVTRYYSAEAMIITSLNGQPVDVAGAGLRASFLAYDYAQALPHMRLDGGALPQPPSAGSADSATPPDALITSQMATDLGLHVGDSLTAAQIGAPSLQLAPRVTGIWEPRQTTDPYWNGRDFQAVTTEAGTTYPVLLDPQAFLQAFVSFPTLETREHWVYYTLPARLSTANMGQLQQNLGALRTQLVNALAVAGLNGAVVLTALPGDIATQQQRLALLAQPLYVVVFQVLGLALLFVAAMAGLLIEGQAAEIATLKSRGAGRVQMLVSYALLGLLLGAAAAVAGPWLASLLSVALIQHLVPAPTLAAGHISQSYLAALATPQSAALPAIGGALLGVAAVVVAAARAAQLDVLAFRRAQGRAHRSFWRRYFLDLQLAAICVIAFVELNQFGGLGTREALNSAANGGASGAGSSPLLFLAPGLLLLAGALVLLRIFPYAVGAGLRLAARTRGAAGMLAFAQVSRSPAAPIRLALLLALAVGLGLFAISFDSSLTSNAADRASYQAGADLRLLQQNNEPGVVDTRLQARLRALPGVVGISAADRERAFTPDAEGNYAVNLLAIDPAAWQQVAGTTSWRADYGAASSASLIAGLRAHQWGDAAADRVGQTNAGDATHPLWAIVSQVYASAHQAHVGDRFPLAIGGAVGSSGAPTTFVIGAIVSYFPTMYPAAAAQGFVVVNLNDYFGALTLANGVNSDANATIGPNEYWLALSGGQTAHDKLIAALQANATQLDVNDIVDRLALQQAIGANPIQSGVRGLLLLGALIAVALAVLGSIAQSAITARARNVQFAVLRTLGLTNRYLTRVLLGEQFVVYSFGLVGGTLLGLLLATATLPFLQFSDTTVDTTQVGVPPVLLAVSPQNILLFYAALVAAFLVALLIAGVYAARTGLGQTLRLGDD